MPSIDFYYDVDDFTLETIADNGVVINQGQNESLEFKFYFGSYLSGSFVNVLNANDIISRPCLLNIERPDTSASNNVATSPVTNNLNDLHYSLFVSDWFTAIAGVLSITAKRYNPVSEEYEVFGIATKNILESASVSLDTIEDAQYQALVNYLATTGTNKVEVVADGSINKLDLVMFTGVVGGSGKKKVAKATQTGAINIKDNPEYIFGIALENAANNEPFYVQTNGLIEKLDTTDFQQGKVLVPSATIAGGLIEVDNASAPLAPLNRMPIAVVIYSHKNNGIMFVRPTFFPKMSQVQDVDMTNIQNNNVLSWTGTKFVGKYMSGVYYNNDVPPVEDRFVNLTYFDEAGIDE